MRRLLTVLGALTALFGLATPGALARDPEWVKLGERAVEFKGDHDVIEIGKSEGKFTHLRFKIEDGDLIMDRIKITFVNGEVFEPGVKQEFREGSRSHEISLPEGTHGRTIRKVEFFYRSERKRDKATLLLYGREKN